MLRNFEERLAAFVNSRAGATLTALWGLIAMIWAGALTSGAGVVNMLLAYVAGLGALGIDHTFNITRGRSAVFAALLPLMMATDPNMAERVNPGVVTALALTGALWVFMRSYNAPRQTRRVFLAFLIIAVTGVFIPSALVFLIVLAVGLGQMHIFKLRPMLAGILGAVTPAWILWGWGAPVRYDVFSAGGLAVADHSQLIAATVTAVLTVVAGMTLSGVNLVRIMSYNSRSRGNNGLLLTAALVATVAGAVRYPAMEAYMPVLFVCMAFQTGHFIVINAQRRWTAFTVPAMVVVFTALTVWTHL